MIPIHIDLDGLTRELLSLIDSVIDDDRPVDIALDDATSRRLLGAAPLDGVITYLTAACRDEQHARRALDVSLALLERAGDVTQLRGCLVVASYAARAAGRGTQAALYASQVIAHGDRWPLAILVAVMVEDPMGGETLRDIARAVHAVAAAKVGERW